MSERDAGKCAHCGDVKDAPIHRPLFSEKHGHNPCGHEFIEHAPGVAARTARRDSEATHHRVAREIVRTYGSDQGGLAGDGSHVEVHAECIAGGIARALAEAEERGAKWALEEAGDRLAGEHAGVHRALGGIDVASICKERRGQ